MLRLDCGNVVVPSPPVTPYCDWRGCLASGSAKPTFLVANINGPDVEVTFWNGSPPITVACGDRGQVPGNRLPHSWDVVVISKVSGAVLFQESETGNIINVIQSGGVSVSRAVAATWQSGPCHGRG